MMDLSENLFVGGNHVLVPVIYPVLQTSTLPLEEYERKRKSVLLLQVYAKYRREFLNPGVNKQQVWRKIAYEMNIKGPFHYDEYYWCSKVEELRQDYERIKYIPVTNEETVDFKIAAENAFQIIGYPVTAVPNKVTATTVSSTVTGSAAPNKVIATTVPNKVTVTTASNTVTGSALPSKVTVSAVPNKATVAAAPNKAKMPRQKQKELDENRLFKRDIALLTLYALHKDEFSIHVTSTSVWKKIAQKINEKFPECDYRPMQCRDKVLYLKKQYEKLKDKNSKEITSRKCAVFLKEAKLVFVTKENPVTFMDDQKREKLLSPLTAFNKYKAQFLSPDVDRQQLWQKISQTEYKLSSRKNPHSVATLRNHMCSLKSMYDNFKDSSMNITTSDEAVFFEKAKLVFESTGSEGIPIDQILHDDLTDKSKQEQERHLALLRAYNIYKTEFSSPDEEDEDVWEKIAGTARIVCSYLWTIKDCRLQLSQMKEKYEKKKQDWSSAPEVSILSEEEKLAFDTVSYPEEYDEIDLLTEIDTNSV